MTKKQIANKLDELYNMGTGSHDTINNKKVSLASWWSCEYKIDNQYFGIDEAVTYLKGGK